MKCLKIFGWDLYIIWGIEQEDELPVWFGMGGFSYDIVRLGESYKGSYLFLYYPGKYVNINFEKNSKVLGK